MVQKYIIDKADIHNLLTGKEIPLERRSKARAFCVEIAGGMTNGDVIQALFPNPHIDTKSHTVWVGYEEMSFTRKWWNAPYQKGGE